MNWTSMCAGMIAIAVGWTSGTPEELVPREGDTVWRWARGRLGWPPPRPPPSPPPPVQEPEADQPGWFTFWQNSGWSYTSIGPMPAQGASSTAGDWSWCTPVFSTAEESGSLSRHGGWVGLCVDAAGYSAFGEWWPMVGGFALLLWIVGTVALTRWGVKTVFAPCRFMVTMAKFVTGKPLGPQDAGTPVGSRAFCPTVEWRGPAAVIGLDNKYFSERVKGRGSRRHANHLLMRHEGRVARVELLPSGFGRVDLLGMTARVESVIGASHRSLRRLLEELPNQTLHLCRCTKCDKGGHGLHVKESAAVDCEALIDLGLLAEEGAMWRCWRTKKKQLF